MYVSITSVKNWQPPFLKIHFSPNFYQCVQWAPPLAQPDPRTASALNISKASYSFTFNGFSRHGKLESTRMVLSALKIMQTTKHFLFSVLFFMQKESLPHASYWSSSCSQKDSIYGHCTWTIMGRSLPLDVQNRWSRFIQLSQPWELLRRSIHGRYSGPATPALHWDESSNA